jgi:nuclear pore complex protein Nup160
MRYSDKALQRRALAALVDAMGTADAVAELLDFPFAGLAPEVDALLLEKAQGKGGAAWSRILYAWRVRRGDLRGAAQALVESGFVGLGAGAGFGGWGGVGGTGHREPAEADWLVLINALVVGGGEEGGYVFVRDRAGTAKRGVGIHHADGDQEMDIDRGADADGAHGAATAAGAEGVRRVVRLRDVRRAYEAWVERRERVQRGAWGIVGDGGDA